MSKPLAALLLFAPLCAFGQNACIPQLTGTDEGARINRAIAACPTGCAIQIPAGTHSVTTPITVCNPNIRLSGDGQGNTTLAQTFRSASNDLILVRADGFELSGVTLMNTNPHATGGNLVHLLEANRARIHTTVFTDPRPQGTVRAPNGIGVIVNGVRIEGTRARPANYNQVIDNSFTVPTIAVTLSTNANSNNIQANQFIDCFTAFDFNGDDADSSGNSFSNNIVSGGSGGNFLQSVTAAVITGNQFIANGTAAGYTLYMTLARGRRQADTLITNNTFRRSPGGALSITNNSRDVIIANNLFADNGTDGIYVANPAGAVTHLNIQSNIFRDNGSRGGATIYAAIRVETAPGVPIGDWIISNNSAYDDRHHPGQAYGLLLSGAGSAFGLTVLGNDFGGNAKGAFGLFVPITSSSLGPNRETAAGGWIYRSTTGAIIGRP